MNLFIGIPWYIALPLVLLALPVVIPLYILKLVVEVVLEGLQQAEGRR